MSDRLNGLVILIIVMILFGCSSPAQISTQSDNTLVEGPTQTVEEDMADTPTTTVDNSGSIQPTARRDEENVSPSETPEIKMPQPTSTLQTGGDKPAMDNAILADVLSVGVSGEEGAYRFSVGISSPDTGCDQYADWWEVIRQDGVLIYRRVLLHSHVDEQPFVRSGGPVSIAPDTVVFVRAHMNTGGYGGAVFQGSVQSGFTETNLDPDFASHLLNVPPLPEGCAF